MENESVKSVLITGNKLDAESVLFKCALDYADSGLNVWVVSPEPFTRIPNNLTPPDTESLKLITFLYLLDRKELIDQLNGIHVWHKCPQLIILNDLQCYCGNYATSSAFAIASVLDAAAVCAHKNDAGNCRLLVSATSAMSADLCCIIEMYFSTILSFQDHDAENLILLIKSHFGN